jgi:hypothetical protein
MTNINLHFTVVNATLAEFPGAKLIAVEKPLFLIAAIAGSSHNTAVPTQPARPPASSSQSLDAAAVRS